MLKNEMESYVRIRGQGFEKSYVPYMGVGGSQKLPKSSLVINEWPLNTIKPKNTKTRECLKMKIICNERGINSLVRKLYSHEHKLRILLQLLYMTGMKIMFNKTRE